MPFSAVTGVKPGRLGAVIRYLQDDAHSHHLEYSLTPVALLGVSSVDAFQAAASQGFRANASELRRGRPPVNAAMWTVVRFPDQTWLREYECKSCAEETCDEVRHGAAPAMLFNFHHNLLTGASDLNVLTVTFSRWGDLVRDRGSHPIQQLRRRMDAVTVRLNAERLKTGIAPILTMAEVQRERCLQRGEIHIIPALAKLTKPPKDTSDLDAALLLIGCQLCAIDWEQDFVFIQKPKRKKRSKLRLTRFFHDLEHERKLLRGLELSPAETLHTDNPEPIGVS